jgi:hypothetical protein
MKRIIRMPSLMLAGTVAVVLGVHSANAASIAWGAAHNITPGNGASDVSTLGTLMDAVAIGGSATVNGVSFVQITGASPVSDGKVTVTYSSFAGAATTGLTFGYATILSYEVHTASDGSNQNVTLGGTLSGLTVGHTYQVQYWANQQSPTGNAAILSGSPSVTLLGDNGSGLGQFAIGTFTADAIAQSFTYHATIGNIAVFDALQFRDITGVVPEPGTWIAGVLVVGALGWSQRRRLRNPSRLTRTRLIAVYIQPNSGRDTTS